MPKHVSCKIQDEELKEFIEGKVSQDGWSKSELIRESLRVAMELGFDVEGTEVEEHLGEQVDELRNELAKRKTEIERLEDHLEGLRRENQQLNERLSDEQQESESFQKLAQLIDQQEGALKKAVSTLEEDIQRHDQNIREHDQQLRNATDGLQNLKDQINEIEESVESIKIASKQYETIALNKNSSDSDSGFL